MYEPLIRWILLPAHERLRGRGTVSFYRRLRRFDRATETALVGHRLGKLRRLLRHAYDHVPFYRERLRTAGVIYPERAEPEQLASLPPLERQDVREHLDGLIADTHRYRLIRYSTGGSTGEPLVFYTDPVKEAQHNAQKLRCRAWFAVLPGSRQVDFWGSPIELDKQSVFRNWKDSWLLNQRLLSAFDLTEARLADYAQVLERFRPRLIYGYPTVIYRVALFLSQTRAPRWRPQLVACTAEMLYEHQRETISRVFGCPVVNEYGARDAGLIAHECPTGSLHIAAEHVLVEVDAPDAEGVGDLLVTNLDAFGMPLVRYRVGDRGSLGVEPCACGLPHPTLTRLTGRTNDFLLGRDDKLVHSLAPIYALREIPKVQQFKIVQRADRSLEIQMVASSAFSDSELNAIRGKMGQILDMEVAVDVIFKDTIEPERSGKYRWVLSEAAQVRP